ncbi:MAG: hypothetical protein U0105_17375 [Candidatus Obscuribacterales bacterium]
MARGRDRIRPIGTYMKGVMNSKGDTRIADANIRTKLQISTLSNWADLRPGDKHVTFDAVLDFCDAYEISADDFLRGLLGRPKPQKEEAV